MWRVFRGGLLLVCAACATVPPTPDALEISELNIEGPGLFEKGELKSKIVTTESSWVPSWVPFFGHSEWFDPVTWQADLRRMQRFYEAKGYYQARVLENTVTQTSPKHVKLLVRLRAGNPARVHSLQWLGLDALTSEERKDAIDGLPIELGNIFLEDNWAKTKSLLHLRLRELGFAEVSVEGEALINAEAEQVDLTLSVTLGKRYRFSDVHVLSAPDARVPAELIAEVATPDVPPGDYFSEKALATAQSRVFQMGAFAAVKVSGGQPNQGEGTIPIEVDVKEAPFQSLRFGGGFGGDFIRQEVRLVGEYTHRDLGLARLFFKGARLDRLTIKAKLGIAFLPNIVEVIRSPSTSDWGPIWRLYTEYEVPRLFGVRTLALQTSLDLSRTLDNTYRYDALEGKMGVIWTPRADLTIFPSLNLSGFFLRKAIELRDTAPAETIGCPYAPEPCVVGFLDVTVEFDRRDNRIEAKEGYYLALSTQGGLSLATQLRPFFKVTPEVRGYFSFGKNKQLTFAGRVKAGTLLAPDDNTPIVVRYFSGGASMRGFQQRRLSPQIAVATRELDPNCIGQTNCAIGTTLPVGGAGLFEASAEIRWEFTENWVLAVFNDWGLVTTAPLGPRQNWAEHLYTAMGLGVRYRTPLGPVRVDLAFRLPLGGPQEVYNPNGQQFRSAQGCFFGLGASSPFTPQALGAAPYPGSPDSFCSAHLSIGEAF